MEKYTITLQDIQENENLKQARAMPGDEIINNELNHGNIEIKIKKI